MGLVDFKLGDVGSVFKDIRAAITGEEVSSPETKLKLLSAIQEAEAKMMEQQASTIVAEAKSGSWITSAWRPITMLVFVFIIANNYIIAPYLLAFGYTVPTLDIPPDMWSLLQLGIGGYIMGRSAEKAVQVYKGD